MPERSESDSSGLVRGLGFWTSTAVVVGAILGQSVFLVASDMARDVGSPSKVLFLWVVGGLIVLCGAICYAELGAMLPQTGGDYIYLSRGIHPACGFLYGWANTMIMLPGAQATIAAGFARLASALLPSIAIPMLTLQLVHGHGFVVTRGQGLAVVSILAVTLLNYFGVHGAGRLQLVFTSLKVAAVSAIIGFGLFEVAPGNSSLSVSGITAPTSISGLLTAFVPVLMAYNGFQHLGRVGGEMLHPRKHLPRALLMATSLVVVLYVLVNWTYFRVLGFVGVAQSQHVASGTVARVAGFRGAMILTLAMMISAFGTQHSGFLLGPRVPFAMAHEGLFFRFAKRVQPRFHTPSGALFLQTSITIALVLSGTYADLYSYAMFAICSFFVLTAVALMRLRRNEPSLSRPFRVWGYPWPPLIFGVAELAVSLNLCWVRPVRSSIGLGIILLGLPFFMFWRGQGAHLAIDGDREPVRTPMLATSRTQPNLRSSQWRVGR